MSIEPSADGSGAAIRVLVVDDDSVLVRSLQRVLSLQGFEVDAALDSRAALHRLETTDYDVMLDALSRGYPDALMGSFDGDKKGLEEVNAELDKRSKKIEDWLADVKAFKK